MSEASQLRCFFHAQNRGDNVIKQPMVYVKDKSLNDIGALEKALQVHPTIKANKLWSASFSLPGDDPKNELCNHFNFIEIISRLGRNKGLYRVMPTQTQKDASTNLITYNCEHAIGTLMDDVMEGQHVFTDMTTKEVLQEILDLQTVKHWELGTVEINNYLNYAFEDENSLLGPIFEIPKNFIDPYLFAYDTTVYPFKLHLLKASDEVVAEMRWGKDMGDFNKVADPTGIINYVIPKGEGEGVNKLTIEDVNDGKNYLKDQASIDKWGMHKRIKIDRRFIDKQSLKAFGQSILDKNKDPKISFAAKSYDLSIKEEYQGTERVLYGMTDLVVGEDVYQVRILEEDIPDLSKEWDVNYKLGNRLDNSANKNAENERRLDVNDSYSVGSTSPLAFNYQDNCDSVIPALIPFYIDDDVINVNTCELTFRTKKFRAYSQATKGGGGTTATSSSGGGNTVTSSSGGSVSKSTESGGSTTQSTPSGGNHRHRLFVDSGGEPMVLSKRRYFAFAAEENYSPSVQFEASAAGSLYTYDADGDHSHSVSIPAHSHSFTIPNHSHTVTIQHHTHSVSIPEHTHEVDHKIVELNELPTSVIIKVDGNTVSHSDINGDRINLVPYIKKDINGKITRGRHEITILPNERARIEADVILRVFIRSHLGVVL